MSEDTPEEFSVDIVWEEGLFYMGEQGENTLERYRHDALEATRHKMIRATSLDEPTPDLVVRERVDLVEDICALVQRYVAHDLEWAALAVEQVIQGAEGTLSPLMTVENLTRRLREVVASIRERGRTS